MGPILVGFQWTNDFPRFLLEEGALSHIITKCCSVQPSSSCTALGQEGQRIPRDLTRTPNTKEHADRRPFGPYQDQPGIPGYAASRPVNSNSIIDWLDYERQTERWWLCRGLASSSIGGATPLEAEALQVVSSALSSRKRRACRSRLLILSEEKLWKIEAACGETSWVWFQQQVPTPWNCVVPVRIHVCVSVCF
ncbi:uncharacterized protein LOC143033476 isoform X2 [Oratosquilla oratoria]|uniref:uncharacterized protein LOC143033476 isoform X2 n=1 Tax=Oratosquilla oratoria TaxID=337810 RepID=UPI003F772FAC